MASSKKVWVLYYHHRHGHDISLYRTRDGAKRAVLAIMRDYRDEFEGLATKKQVARFKKALAARDVGIAQVVWENVMDEYFEIEEQSVLP